jgi:hypothetical protein
VYPRRAEHTYLFLPGRWVGKGMLTIIGGASEPITVEMIVSQGGTGTITAHLELDFSVSGREGGLEVVYTISPNGGDTFEIVENHSKLGTLLGTGAITKRTILITFQSPGGEYSGFEAMERIDERHYHLRSALSLNGIPTTVLEAAVRKTGGEI